MNPEHFVNFSIAEWAMWIERFGVESVPRVPNRYAIIADALAFAIAEEHTRNIDVELHARERKRERERWHGAVTGWETEKTKARRRKRRWQARKAA